MKLQIQNTESCGMKKGTPCTTYRLQTLFVIDIEKKDKNVRNIYLAYEAKSKTFIYFDPINIMYA